MTLKSVLLERSLPVQCLYNDIIVVEVLAVGSSPYSPVLVSTLILELTTIGQLLMSVGGHDHRIPQCNHLTLFGSAVSVVEFPPHRKFLCWTLQKFPVKRSCLTVCRLSFCRVSPALT